MIRGWRFGLIVLLLLHAGCAWMDKGVLPEIKKDCSLCHIMGAGKAAGRLLKPAAQLCQDCHPERSGGREHAVDIAPSMAVTRLPLQNGKLTCVTCHDPHRNRYGSLLRVRPRELCRVCHNK